MLRLLLLAILLIGCSEQGSPPLVQSTLSTDELMQPYRTTTKIQTIPEKSIGLGLVVVGAVGFLLLSRK